MRIAIEKLSQNIEASKRNLSVVTMHVIYKIKRKIPLTRSLWKLQIIITWLSPNCDWSWSNSKFSSDCNVGSVPSLPCLLAITSNSRADISESVRKRLLAFSCDVSLRFSFNSFATDRNNKATDLTIDEA